MAGLDFRTERIYWDRGARFLAGVDEAGRGPLAGPVVAAAVIANPGAWIEGIDDSKKLSPSRREELFELITRGAISVGIGVVPHTEIDRVNILKATMQAMAGAVSQLDPAPDHLLVDGPRYDGGRVPFTPLIGGDAMCYSIAAASIVAKVTRDRIMTECDRAYPGYGFAKHKGYGTPEHLDAIRTLGPCEIHRRSFRMPAFGAPGEWRER
jgi:ribonuclease HII